MPVEILGMNSSAYAGAEFMVTKSEDEAKEMMKYKKDNKLPNTKNVRRQTNPAGVTTIIEPKKNNSGSGGVGGGQVAGGGNTNQTK